MAEGEEKQHHHLFHCHKEKLKHHKHLGNVSKVTAIAAGAYAVHEKHKAKKDPENAHHHKIAEEVAATVAVGATGFAIHEHHKKKDAEKQLKEDSRTDY